MPKKRDNCHAEIREIFEQFGFVVYDTADQGHGMSDLIAVRADGRVWLVEAKAEDGTVTPAEYRFIVKLVNPAYRIFHNAQMAADAIWKER
jgi:hypothetical protein